MTITTAAELDALPHGAVVVDNHKCPWQKLESPELDAPVWVRFGKEAANVSSVLAHWAPLEVLSTDLTTAKKYDLTVSSAR